MEVVENPNFQMNQEKSIANLVVEKQEQQQEIRSKVRNEITSANLTLESVYNKKMEELSKKYKEEAEALRIKISGDSVYLREKFIRQELNLNRTYQGKINGKYALAAFCFFAGFAFSLLLIFVFWFFAKNNGDIESVYNDVFCSTVNTGSNLPI